jgi:hypothetical protein
VSEQLKFLIFSRDFQQFMKCEMPIIEFIRVPVGTYPEPDKSTTIIPSPIDSFRYYSLTYT